MAEHRPIRMRTRRPAEHQAFLSRIPGVDVEIMDLPDDPLTAAELAAAGPARPVRPEPPGWFVEMLKQRASPTQVLETLHSRVLDNEDLRQAQNLINEIGRLPDSGRVLRSFVTQDIINRLSRRRHHER